MKKLHLVGFTPDNDGLILSPRKGAKTGGFVVDLDDTMVSAIELARRRRDGELIGGSAGDQDAAARPAGRPPSALSPREIQARLRAGSTISDVAGQAGVDEEWIQRFAAPILAEQAQVVASAQRLIMAKSRRGPSIEPLAPSVHWNLSDRGVRMSDDVFSDCWSAYNLHGARWAVRFAYTSRKRRQAAEWEVDLRERSLVARNRLASDLGHVEPGRRRPTAEALEDATAEPPAAVPPPVASAGAARRAPAKAPARSVAKRAPAARTAASAPANRRATRTTAAQRASRQPAAKKAQAVKKAVKKAAKEAPGAVAPPDDDRPSHLGRPPSPMKFANRATSLPLHRSASPYNRPRPAPAPPGASARSAPGAPPRSPEPANPANPRFEPRPEPDPASAGRPAAKGASRPTAPAQPPPVAPAIGRRPKATRPEDGDPPRPAVVILSTPAREARSPTASDDDERRARLASAERLRAALSTPPPADPEAGAAPGPPAEAGAGAQPDQPRSRQGRRQAASS